MATPTTTVRYINVNRALVLIAVIIFILAAFNVNVIPIGLVPLGLAVWAAATLLP